LHIRVSLPSGWVDTRIAGRRTCSCGRYTPEALSFIRVLVVEDNRGGHMVETVVSASASCLGPIAPVEPQRSPKSGQ
jgi:urease gamma subunit